MDEYSLVLCLPDSWRCTFWLLLTWFWSPLHVPLETGRKNTRRHQPLKGTHMYIYTEPNDMHTYRQQMISYECVQEHVKSVYSAHLNTHAHFYLNSENIHNFLRCCLSMLGWHHVWPWLGEFTGALPSHFTLSRSTIFRDRSLIKLENSFNPVSKAILY